MNGYEFMQHLARAIVEVEVQQDSFGKTHDHLIAIARGAELNKFDGDMYAMFAIALEKEIERVEEKIVFDVITKDLFTPEEEENINGGDSE